MLDESLDPILIEINHAPAFGTDSNLDFNCKSKLLKDTFRMLNMSLKRKLKYKKDRNKISQNRIMSIKKDFGTQDNREKKRIANFLRHKFEMENKGNYELLYPILQKNGEIIPDIGDNYLTNQILLSTHSSSVEKLMSEELKNIQKENSSRNTPEKLLQREKKNLSEEEIIAEKYNKFAQDAFKAWDDLISGCFRTRTRFLIPEDSEIRISK